MNAKALKIAARRSGRFNLLALLAVLAVAGFLVLKSQSSHDRLQARHFVPAHHQHSETAL